MKQKKRIKEIKDRIKYLKIEIVHRNYWPGRVVEGFEKELLTLNIELENLEGESE